MLEICGKEHALVNNMLSFVCLACNNIKNSTNHISLKCFTKTNKLFIFKISIKRTKGSSK